MILSLVLLSVARQAFPETWYGPVEVRFALEQTGNPYDPAQNDVEVQFRNETTVETRYAYFDGEAWRCRLVAHRPGTYTATVLRNGDTLRTLKEPVQLDMKQDRPYVRIDDGRFVTSDGQPFWPLGHNLAWTTKDLYPILSDQMATMAANGVNWCRVWSTFWDGRNPYWPQSDKLQDGWYDPAALDRWDTIIRTAEHTGVRVQWTLHHHGQWSTKTDPNWAQNPWNTANGGFLADPVAFFTDPEARRRTKAYLRYIVARYGDSPSIFAWELFNEVENTDAAQKGDWTAIGAWHDEMTTYLRQIDPYHHLITTSSDMTKPIWRYADFYQPHGYPASLRAMILGAKRPQDKPMFWGEIGSPSNEDQREAERFVVRDGIWDGLLAGDQGSAQYWDWDRLWKHQAWYAEYKQAAQIIKSSGFLTQSSLTPLLLKLDTPTGGPLQFAPGLGWAPSTQVGFALPDDTSPTAMGKLSEFLQGRYHPDLGKNEWVFNFKAKEPGTFMIKLVGVSDSGAELRVSLNGKELKTESFPAGSKIGESWEFQFGAGPNRFVLTNAGPDWVRIGGFTVTGMAPAVRGVGLSSGAWALLRLVRGTEITPSWTATNLPLADGRYAMTTWDLDSGASATNTVNVQGGRLGPQDLTSKDVIAVLRKQ